MLNIWTGFHFLSVIELTARLLSLSMFVHVLLIQGLSEDRHSPPLLTVNGPGEEKLFRSKSAEVELTVEKERVKKMLSEG